MLAFFGPREGVYSESGLGNRAGLCSLRDVMNRPAVWLNLIGRFRCWQPNPAASLTSVGNFVDHLMHRPTKWP